MLLAVCEAIRPPADLAVLSYPIIHGRWHGEEEHLRELEHQIHINPDLATWAYGEAGRELEEIRTNAGYTPSWMYIQGDKRPLHLRTQMAALPPVPILDARSPDRWSPPTKAAPAQPGVATGRGYPPFKPAPDHIGDATSRASQPGVAAGLEAAARAARQAEAAAARQRSAHEDALAEAEEVTREKERAVYTLRMQQTLLDEAHALKTHNMRAALLQADQERQAATQKQKKVLMAQQAAERQAAADEQRSVLLAQQAGARQAPGAENPA